MNVQEFKKKYPHLAHLEGDALWDAMEAAVYAEQEPWQPLPGDDEIHHTEEYDGYKFHITVGAQRAWMKLIEGAKPAGEMFSNFGWLIPNSCRKNDDHLV